MRISSVTKNDFDRLTEIWEGAVQMTHSFLTEADILFYKRQVREVYLAAVELVAVKDEAGMILGFMGMSPPNRIEMLFVDPVCMRKGVGSFLIHYALEKHGSLELDVNEQNPAAIDFYEKLGFIRVGRSELDGQGKPFPLLHMRLERNG